MNESPFINVRKTLLSKEDALPQRTLHKVILQTLNSSLSPKECSQEKTQQEVKKSINELKPPIEFNKRINKIKEEKKEDTTLKIDNKVNEPQELEGSDLNIEVTKIEENSMNSNQRIIEKEPSSVKCELKEVKEVVEPSHPSTSI